MQIEAYRHMITPVVDAFKYLTQVCIFILFSFHYLVHCINWRYHNTWTHNKL